MTRYFSKPRMAAWTAPSEIEEAEPVSPSVTVWLDDARDTGLLDADGNPIMASERAQIGFIRSEDE